MLFNYGKEYNKKPQSKDCGKKRICNAPSKLNKRKMKVKRRKKVEKLEKGQALDLLVLPS